jgi:hypothetical protein
MATSALTELFKKVSPKIKEALIKAGVKPTPTPVKKSTPIIQPPQQSIMYNPPAPKIVPNPAISPNYVPNTTIQAAPIQQSTWEGTPINKRVDVGVNALKAGDISKSINVFKNVLSPELKQLATLSNQAVAREEAEKTAASKYPTMQTPNWPTPTLTPGVTPTKPLLDTKKGAFYQLPKATQQAETKKIIEENNSKANIQNIIQRADAAFVSSLKKVRPDLLPKNAAAEQEQIIKNAPSNIFGKAIHGFAGGATMGLTDMAKERYGLDYEDNLPTIYSENEGLKSLVNTVGGVANFTGNIAGGLMTFGAIAGPMSKAISKIPVVGKVLSAHPVFTSYVVDNAILNASTGMAKKTMGLDYTVDDFFNGMITNAAFMAGGKIISTALGKLPMNIEKTALSRFEKTLKEAEKQKGEKLTSDEVSNVLMNTVIMKNVYGRDLFNAKRAAFLKGKNKGTPGIDYSSPPARTSLETPSVKDFAKYKEMAKDIDFPNTDSMKLIRDKASGEIIGVQNRTGQSKMFNEIPVESYKVVLDALKGAKPIRAEQEAIYHKARSEAAAKLEAIGKTVPGEAGYYAQLGSLKGEMGKVTFESVRSKLPQPVIDDLFASIEKSKLLTFEKVTAKNGLAKLIGAEGGRPPTIGELELLNTVFPPEFVKGVLANRPLMTKLWEGTKDVLNLPRAMMATADLSAPFRQGALMATRPKQFMSAFVNMFKYAFSEKAYKNLDEQIKLRPTYKAIREAGIAITTGPIGLSEESFLSKLAEKIPIFGRLAKGSNRAYSGFLTKLRVDVFDDLYGKATKLGLTENNPKLVKDLGKFINTATGRGEIGKMGEQAAPILNALFFSPRLMASRIQTLNPAYYANLDPFVRKEALKTLFSFVAATTTGLGLVKAAGGEVGVDPRSADFGKIKIGNSRFDILGGFQQYIVLGSRLSLAAAKAVGAYKGAEMVSSTTGKEFTLGEGYKPTTAWDIAMRFLESKEAPVTSLVVGMMKGKTAIGEDFDTDTEVAKRFIPMVFQDAYTLYKEYGPEGLGLAIPGLFGAGSQTYSDPIPMESKTAKGNPTIKYKSKPGMVEDMMSFATGTTVVPTPVKAIYDNVQKLKTEGNIDEAEKIVNDLSEKNYELYKKFKQKDAKIAKDEMTSKVLPIYKENLKLKESGDLDKAQANVDALTDEEHKIYLDLRDTDLRNLQ